MRRKRNRHRPGSLTPGPHRPARGAERASRPEQVICTAQHDDRTAQVFQGRRILAQGPVHDPAPGQHPAPRGRRLIAVRPGRRRPAPPPSGPRRRALSPGWRVHRLRAQPTGPARRAQRRARMVDRGLGIAEVAQDVSTRPDEPPRHHTGLVVGPAPLVPWPVPLWAGTSSAEANRPHRADPTRPHQPRRVTIRFSSRGPCINRGAVAPYRTRARGLFATRGLATSAAVRSGPRSNIPGGAQ